MQELKMTYAVIQYSQVFDINNNSAGHSYKETNSYGINQWNNSLTASQLTVFLRRQMQSNSKYL